MSTVNRQLTNTPPLSRQLPQANLGSNSLPALFSMPQDSLQIAGGASPIYTDDMLERRLNQRLSNSGYGVVHGCFAYAWNVVTSAGGRPLGSAPELSTGRYRGTAYLSTMEAQGLIKTGDIIYVNRSPLADPSSTNLAYGPHWFVYLGHGRFADQYGVKSATEMDYFVPGRFIDTIFRPF